MKSSWFEKIHSLLQFDAPKHVPGTVVIRDRTYFMLDDSKTTFETLGPNQFFISKTGVLKKTAPSVKFYYFNEMTMEEDAISGISNQLKLVPIFIYTCFLLESQSLTEVVFEDLVGGFDPNDSILRYKSPRGNWFLAASNFERSVVEYDERAYLLWKSKEDEI